MAFPSLSTSVLRPFVGRFGRCAGSLSSNILSFFLLATFPARVGLRFQPRVLLGWRRLALPSSENHTEMCFMDFQQLSNARANFIGYFFPSLRKK